MCKIVKLSELNDNQSNQATDIFVEGFYNTLQGVSKNKALLHKLFRTAFDRDMTYIYLQGDDAVGFLGVANCQKRPIKLSQETFIEELGPSSGQRLYKAVSSAMEKIIVQDPDEIWIDYIATSPNYRSMGIGRKLIEYICDNLDYKYIRLMVLSKNPRAIAFYEKFGFRKESEKSRLLVRLQGFGKEITMRLDNKAYNDRD